MKVGLPPIRVFFAVSPGIGQCLPVLPLAWAVRASGGDVLMGACGEALAVAGSGLAVADVGGRTTTMTFLQQRLRGDRPDVLRELRASPFDDPTRLAIGFTHLTRYLADATVAAAEAWKADVVVTTQFNAAGLAAATALGIPAVHHGFGPVRTRIVADVAGIDLPDTLVDLDVAPPSIADSAPGAWPMRYLPHDAGTATDWMHEPPARARPRIAVTLGTVIPREAGLGALHRILEIAPEVDAELVVAMREADIRDLPALPANVRAAGWMPMGLLLRQCAAVIHHGGAGSTMTALSAGIPQLVLPDGADRYINAEAVRRCGAGIVAEQDDLTAAHVWRLLDDLRLRDAARTVAAEMASMPPPAELVPRLAALGRPVAALT